MAVYTDYKLDESYTPTRISIRVGTNFNDLQQIEVYRGPQGTLFGQNSTGGVIAITTQRPNLEEYHGNIELTYGQYDTPGGSTDLTKIAAAVDVPRVGRPRRHQHVGPAALSAHAGRAPVSLLRAVPHGGHAGV